MKRQNTDKEKIFVNHIFDKELVSAACKDSQSSIFK